ncbi:MAG: FtsH protease activity modulator HflK [Phenylobacterium sp.]|uniref:FtsH protease activity modulator HflK n=1 Tax=Phenylobacterium sp. TaxID=1871053 RepID=UPI00273509A6|nr:FtsH protease activity modulator HflK [Phenylobacterium sp.]MDP3748888.1 FtsH protease activity modulator HflK [Phenylobacterium sp.]
MPWNDNANPGPWGAPPPNDGGDGKKPPGPRRPLGGGGPRGPRRPDGPELNAALERLQRQIRDFFGGPDGQGIRPSAVAAVAGVGFGLWALSGVYIVEPNEQAVVTTFGAYSRSEGPGIRYHLPAPIEQAEKVAVTSLNRLDIGGVGESDVPEESLMLTGDENIVDLDFSVTWRVADASRYVFTLRDPDVSVKAAAESAMREVIGKSQLQPILTTGRGRVQVQTAELMQRTLDSWGAGISVVEVQIRSANPPKEVAAAFRDVNSAGQDQESARNEANTYRNRVINEAKGDAARLIQSAQGYREQSVREATGDVARFDQIYTEYRRAPGVTKERLYIETMQRVLANSNKVVIDGKGASAPIILPPDVFRPRSSTARTAPVEAAAPPAVAAVPGATR